MDCLPEENYTIPSSELQKRLDLRGLSICSVDPPGCKDIDDALHCIKLSNGNYQVGVHIADVSYFVKPDTAIDKEAANRCTTVYLVIINITHLLNFYRWIEELICFLNYWLNNCVLWKIM